VEINRRMIISISVVFLVISLGWMALITRYQYNSTSNPRGLPLVTKIDRWTGDVYCLAIAGDDVGEWVKLSGKGSGKGGQKGSSPLLTFMLSLTDV